MRNYLLALFIIVFGYAGIAQTIIQPDDPNIQYFGRWDWSGGNPKCTWPSLYLKAKFTGTSIKAKFTNTFYNGENLVHILYTIDGGAPIYINNVTEFTINGLSAGEHEIMISRRMEANGAELTFNGFEINGGNLITPNKRPCVKFEFVGNSITCGLANENFNPQWNDGNGTWIANGWEQNSYRSYAPVLSRMMDAEYRIESHSGQGMYINLNNSLPEAKASDEWELKAYYPGWAKPGWQDKHDFANDPWKADFFFTLLGTNDWSDNNYNQGLINIADYKARYKQFINLVFSKYPNTTFFVVTPILDIRGWADGETAHQQIVSEMQAAGKDVHLIDISQLLVNQQDFGNDWTHPTTMGHQKMANKIKEEMLKIPSVAAKLNTLQSACNNTPDCNGDVGGTASVDACGVCSGGNTGVIPNSTCSVACDGVKDGTAYLDSCGTCVGGTTGKTACTKACDGVWGGTAALNGCNGECTGGTTGVPDCGMANCDALNFNSNSEYANLVGSATALMEINNGKLIVTGNGTTAWDAAAIELNTPIDFTNSSVKSKKLYLRVKASSKVLIQPSFMDGKGNVVSNNNLAGWNSPSDQKKNLIEATTTWTDYIIDFEGNFTNQWGCACDIDQTDITKIYVGINPGWGTQWPPSYKDGNEVTSGFTGTIEFEYFKIADENCSSIVTSLLSKQTSDQIKLYPNPTVSSFTVKGYTGQYQIYSLSGQLMESNFIREGGVIGNHLQPGSYIVQLNHNNSIVNKTIIKL